MKMMSLRCNSVAPRSAKLDSKCSREAPCWLVSSDSLLLERLASPSQFSVASRSAEAAPPESLAIARADPPGSDASVVRC